MAVFVQEAQALPPLVHTPLVWHQQICRGNGPDWGQTACVCGRCVTPDPGINCNYPCRAGVVGLGVADGVYGCMMSDLPDPDDNLKNSVGGCFRGPGHKGQCTGMDAVCLARPDLTYLQNPCREGVVGLGVADGVYGWKEQGIDSGVFSRQLMRHARDAIAAGQADPLKGGGQHCRLHGGFTLCAELALSKGLTPIM